jgi:hypothetical protein
MPLLSSFPVKCRDGSSAQLFYQYGERKHSLKRCSDAVEWFLLGTRRAFSSVADTYASKCFRKAALCHIEREEYAQASEIIRQCPGEEAATNYLSFLVAVKQGEGYFLGCVQWHSQFYTDLAPKVGKMTVWDQLISLIITVSPPHDDAFPTLAIRAVRAMINGSGFDQRMLLMATRLAHETDLKNVLLSVLQELLDYVRAGKSTEMNVEPVTLIRCIIRLVLRLIADPANAEGR